MEFCVRDQSVRRMTTVMVILCWILWIASAVLYMCSTQMNFEIWMVVLGLMVLGIILAITLFVAIHDYAVVIIDENGVCLKRGKLVLKKFSWDEVKRIEKVKVRGGTIINVLTHTEASHSFNSNICFDNIFSKSRITLMYYDEAISQIRKHIDICVYEN